MERFDFEFLSDKVFIFELNKKNNKKFWIENLQTKRQLWGGLQASILQMSDKTFSVNNKSTNSLARF